jgi:hypothetical protein
MLVRHDDRHPFRFSASTYVTTGDPEALEFTLRRGRDQDVTLADTVLLSTANRLRAETLMRAVHFHDKGPRLTGTVQARLQESETIAIQQLMKQITEEILPPSHISGPFDVQRFSDAARAWLSVRGLEELAGSNPDVAGTVSAQIRLEALRELQTELRAAMKAGVEPPPERLALWRLLPERQAGVDASDAWLVGLINECNGGHRRHMQDGWSRLTGRESSAEEVREEARQLLRDRWVERGSVPSLVEIATRVDETIGAIQGYIQEVSAEVGLDREEFDREAWKKSVISELDQYFAALPVFHMLQAELLSLSRI